MVNIVDPEFLRPVVMYRGEDVAEKFVRDLQQEAKQLFHEYIKSLKPLLLTATELRSFRNARSFPHCGEPSWCGV